MDPYDALKFGVGPNGASFVEGEIEILRRNMGAVLAYGERIYVAARTPRGDLCSTGYCLANPAGTGAEYLTYLPEGGEVAVDFSGTLGELTFPIVDSKGLMQRDSVAVLELSAIDLEKYIMKVSARDYVLFDYYSDCRPFEFKPCCRKRPPTRNC